MVLKYCLIGKQLKVITGLTLERGQLNGNVKGHSVLVGVNNVKSSKVIQYCVGLTRSKGHRAIHPETCHNNCYNAIKCHLLYIY
jgi:hypothetical protein